ncbi:MAG: flagellar basal body P-ring formation chaperone FlgA, partial [Limisphaerales bacterium]
RFDIRGTNNESFGQWQVPVQARLWRDVLVAGSSLSRGQGLATADVHPERRDTLTLREFIVALPGSLDAYELAESLSAGRELTGRSLRARPVIFRGKVVDAVAADSTLHISVKVEALEDGAPGQTIRVRNMQSKREFRAKIQNEATVHVSL